MSQHDYNIANQLFPDTRVDWNAVLLAIATSNAGAAMPATTFGSMVAYNETDDVFYMRNKANSAWVAMGKIISDKWYPYLDGAQLGQGTDSVKGIWEKANAAEAAALSSDLLVLTPLMLASVLCTESALGIARFGTTAEVETGTAADRALSVLQFARTWKEGGAIASATTLVEPTDANKGGVYSLTGSVTVAHLWSGETPGRKVQLRVAGTPQFTNSATLIIPGGTRTFAAGDVLEFTAEAANVWRLTNALLANGKALVETPIPTDVFSAQLLHIRDEKSSGTDGGVSVADAWTKHTLDDVKVNEIAGASVSGASVITLPAGTYYIEAESIFISAGFAKMRLRNTSDGTTAVVGKSDFNNGGGLYSGVPAPLVGRFTIAGSKNFELQYYVDVTDPVGLGVSAGTGEVEIYADCRIWKVA